MTTRKAKKKSRKKKIGIKKKYIYGVMDNVVGNGHGDTSSNPGRD